MSANEKTSKPGFFRTRLGIALGLGSLAIVGTGLAAAGGMGGCEGYGGHGGHGEHARAWMHDGEISAEHLQEMKTRMLERAADRLKLSDAQRQQAETILDAATPEALAGMQRMADARAALHQASGAESFDQAGIDRASAEMGKAIAELATLRGQVMGQLSETLDADQRQQLQDMMDKRGHHGGYRG
jgi:Spy/CpxP family protein refolding chaperone